MLTVAIVGGSGYVGGELLRLLLSHPEVRIAQVSSQRHAGQFVHSTHPTLRGHTELRYVRAEAIAPCDVLILALPHGEAARRIDHWAALAPRIIDCSADFRLGDAETYERWYGAPHPAPEWLGRFVYGLPELYREELRTARYVSGVGCNATAVNLALLPLVRAGLIEERPIIAEVKVGSSEAGATESASSHHPERAGVMRSFAPVGHRHTAEVVRCLGVDAHLSLTAIDTVRGALATCHAWARPGTTERDLWRAYRAIAAENPALRIVHERAGLYRHPEPKLLAGTAYADLGWAFDPATGRVVALAALDNLGKGAAGTAIQCLNLIHGLPEMTALGAIGLHPI